MATFKFLLLHIIAAAGQDRSPNSVIFLARIACRYFTFELPASMLEPVIPDAVDSHNR